MRNTELGGEGLQGERKSNKVMVRHRERGDRESEVPQDLVNIRSSWFTALCVGGEGESVMSKVAKKVVY